MSIIITKQCEGLAEIRNHTFPEVMFIYLKMKTENARRLKGRCLLANMFLVIKNSKQKIQQKQSKILFSFCIVKDSSSYRQIKIL